MATSTSRAGLTKPSAGETVRIGDINENMDRVDELLGAFICTSSTRPSQPFQGMVIYETDTQKVWIWGGSSWEFVSGPFVGNRRAVYSRSSSVGIPNSTWTRLTGFTLVSSTGSPSDDFSVSGGTITCNFTGWVKIRGRVTFATNSTGGRHLRICRNSASVGGNVRATANAPASPAGATDVTVDWDGPVSSGWYFDFEVSQSSGGSLNVLAGGDTAESTVFVFERME